MKPNNQIILGNKKTMLYPLKYDNLDTISRFVHGNKIWEQNPGPYQLRSEDLCSFFYKLIQDGCVYKIVDKKNGRIIGYTSFYDYDDERKSIAIGYTFYAAEYFSKKEINYSVKKLMVEHAFEYVRWVYFYIGTDNIRSQIAIMRLGAKKIGELDFDYFGETPRPHAIYAIDRKLWNQVH